MAMRPPRGGKQPATPSRPSVGVRPVYEDFKPISEWQEDGESDILLIYLPGFLRQHLKVSTEGANIVRAKGERLDAGNKRSRFQEDYQVPERCNIRAVRAKFEGGILTITMPWKQEIKESSKQAAVVPAIPPMQAPPKSSSSPDAQKRFMIPPKELEESTMPHQKGFNDSPPKKQLISPPQEPKESKPQERFDDIPAKLLTPPKLMSPRREPKESIPQKGFDDIPPRVVSPPKLVSPPKDPNESIPQKGFDHIPPKVLSPSPLTPGSSGKGMNEKIISEPITTQKSRDEQKDRLTDPPKIATLPAITICNDIERRGESSKMKGRSTKLEILEIYKGGVVTDGRRPNEKSKGLADHSSAENAPKENGNEEMEIKQTTATTARTDYGLRNYEQAAKSLAELNEERQLLVNVGVAVLVIVALGTYIIKNIQSGESE